MLKTTIKMAIENVCCISDTLGKKELYAYGERMERVILHQLDQEVSPIIEELILLGINEQIINKLKKLTNEENN
jgi:hypothetical protein